jgi:sRNA-binding regulator protein Hfq
MESENLRTMFEELKATKTKMSIYLVHGGYRKGYILEIREDCVVLERHQNSERIDYVIPFQAISSVDVKHR